MSRFLLHPYRSGCALALALLLAAGSGVGQNQTPNPAQAAVQVQFAPSAGAFPLVAKGKAAALLTDPADAEVVRIAAAAFQQDVEAVTGVRPALGSSRAGKPSGYVVIAGTLGQSALIDQLAKSQKFPAARLQGQWESFSISVVKNPLPGVPQALVVAGSDRRGTAFGLFELSRRMGVQPFTWWADIVPRHQDALYVPAGAYVEGPPAVKYRGIFLNDEDWGLQPWAARNLDTDVKDIGPKTYAKVFELLLRLKANYIWPAMHECTKAFWYYKDNPKVAEQYAIVLGASHCEPMLRNNVFEWTENYAHEYGQQPREWRYDVNKTQIQPYWNDRAKESKNNDAVYTVGMRGIHDGSMPGPDSQPEKIKLLEQVMQDQRGMLSANLGRPAERVPQLFCPYKEVLNLYQAGMKLPEDITIAWADDNNGYIRQLSSPLEQKRAGGSGVYYHLSYWGAPRDYLWLSSNSPALIAYEMNKAYQFGANRLWVVNVGDIKPAELETQFFLDLAWNPSRWTPERAHQYPREWAAATFGVALAEPVAALKREYYRLAAAGKPEHLDQVAFTPAQIETRLADYRQLGAQATALNGRIPKDLRDAYFQLILYPVEGARLMNEKVLLARESLRLAARQDRRALDLAGQAQAAFARIQSLTEHYNTGQAGGKWNGMMSWHPRDQDVFKMPPVATESMLSAAPKTAAAPSVATPQVLNAAKFAGKREAGGGRFQAVPGLGIDDNGLTVLPFVVKSYAAGEVTAAPYVDYQVKLSLGAQQIVVKCLPNFRIYDGLALRYAISVNGEAPQVQSVGTLAETAPWETNVMRGYSLGVTQHEIKQAAESTIRVYFLDPGLVLSTLEISANSPSTLVRP